MSLREVPALERESYQRAVRVLLANHLVTENFPDRLALPLVRRWATELREDLLELCGYRVEVTETTARLYPVIDRLDPTRPARAVSERVFDRRRYAYLALALAALGRGSTQITLSELADQVSADASRIDGLQLSTARAADRDAFVDAVGWLAIRGAISLADGDAGGWATDPGDGEALYDIDRAVVAALFRPGRVLQHITGVRALLSGEQGPGNAETGKSESAKDGRRRVRRLLVQNPVVYYDELDEQAAAILHAGDVVDEVVALTGMPAERRAEGVALIDHSGRMSDQRFPSTGTVAQVALLLAGELADRVLDPDATEPPRLPLPEPVSAVLAAQLDAAIPRAGLVDEFAVPGAAAATADGPRDRMIAAPLVESSWIDEVMRGMLERFGHTFAAQWRADPGGLARASLAVLERLGMVRVVDEGVLVLPVLARYRDVVVQVRSHSWQSRLFDA
ncbi:TIGR02678 family protein [Rhodococcus sp. D2-41]|uniref:TIGR02678 family protein n=1 Tax=Speluncibacter jeojiensis TaxID=2710754 RepID=UPI00240FF13E|nr:TIGR02678 family protein [Rhodococcus sp. D2-41]MDG3009543.1 TIGR02678 family protein [Rhodococcus sp. D2-41]